MNTKGIFSSKTILWETPKELFDKLNREYNFTLDVCAIHKNAKCKKYFTPQQNGLKQNWGGALLHESSLWRRNRKMD